MRSSWRSHVWFWVRLGFSIALLWFAFRPIDWDALIDSSQQLSAGWLFVALGLIAGANILASLRWGWICRCGGLVHPWSRYIGMYFAGGLINQGLPSTLGGDTYRAIQSARHKRIEGGPALRYGSLCVVLDRGMGLLSNILLGSMGLVLGGHLLAPWAPLVGWLVLGVVGLGIFVAGFVLRVPWVCLQLGRLLRALHLPHGISAALGVLKWPRNLGQIALGLMVHLLTLGCFAACVKAYGISVPFEAIMIGMPALTLLMMLPISISGWGLRETTLAAVLMLWEVPASTTVLASISYGLTVVLCYLPAAWFLIHHRPPTVSQSE